MGSTGADLSLLSGFCLPLRCWRPLAFFWRAPLALGDQALTGIWRLLGRFRGEETVTYPRMSDLEEPDAPTIDPDDG